MNSSAHTLRLLSTCSLLLLCACSSQSGSSEAAEAPGAEPSSESEPGMPEPQDSADEGADHAAPAAQQGLPELAPVPEGAKVFFIEPADGATVSGDVQNGKVAVAIKMGAEGIAVKPAGPPEPGAGHHHVVIDAPAPEPGTVIPPDERHVHFGKAQTEGTLQLTPGKHTLTLQFGDGLHRSFGPALASTVTVTVQPSGVPRGAADSHEATRTVE